MRIRAARWLTLSAVVSLTVAGCGGDGQPLVDAGGSDQAAPGTCGVDNGGCSVAPMVVCGTNDLGVVVCGACPQGYTGDGVTCTRVGCDDASDCDDQVACTVDSCSQSGSCLHAPTSALCSSGGTCHPVSGCVAGVICGSPADCMDSDPCTLETCNTSTATCTFELLDSDDDGEAPVICGGTDCNDAAGNIGASRNEVCGNGIDEDCDGTIDSDATVQSDPNLRNQELNCGMCGRACAQGESCYQGECVGCAGTPGEPCCNTFCISADTCGLGTCAMGGSCVITGGSAICAGPCGAVSEPCCDGSACDFGGVCNGADLCVDPSTVTCTASGTPSVYRITMLHVPTLAEANAGAIVGHDLDNVQDTCGIPDYTGGVDNAFIELVDYLETLNSADPYVLQDEVTAALNCVVPGPSCARLDLFLEVRTGTGCLRMEIQDAAGNVLAGPFAAVPSAGGDFIGRAASFTIPIPQRTTAGPVTVNFRLRHVTLSGTLFQGSLTNLIIGGAILPPDYANLLMALAPIIGGGVTYEDDLDFIPNLINDIANTDDCQGLSIGLLGSGTLVPD